MSWCSPSSRRRWRRIAIRFGPPEYTALLVLGLIFLAYMSSSSLIRTLLMACLGLLLGMIGIDNMTGHFRYSFDLAELGDGIGIVPVAVGLFGLGEILSTPSADAVKDIITPQLRDLLPTRKEWGEAAMPIARGTLARLHHRHHPGISAHHFQFPVLRAGKTRLQASGGIRQGRRRRRRRDRKPPTMPPQPAPSCRCLRSASRPARSPRC